MNTHDTTAADTTPEENSTATPCENCGNKISHEEDRCICERCGKDCCESCTHYVGDLRRCDECQEYYGCSCCYEPGQPGYVTRSNP